MLMMMRRNFLARTQGRRFLIFGRGGKVRTRHYEAVFILLAEACQGVTYRKWFKVFGWAIFYQNLSGLFLRR